MEWLKKKYEFAALGIGALLAIVAGGWFLMQSLGFSSSLKKRLVSSNKETIATLEPIPGTSLAAARELMKKEIIWAPTKLGGASAASLFIGSPIVQKAGGDIGGVRILDPGSDPLRPPVPNDWLYYNGIDLTRSDCLETDFDKDSFSNLEEYEAATDPRDDTSKPLPHKKLLYVESVKDSYEIKWLKMGATEFQVQRVSGGPEGKPDNKIGAKIGDTVFKDARFQIEKVEEKDGKSFMSFKDLKNPVGSPFEVEEKAVFDRFTLRAKLSNVVDGKTSEVKEGDVITIDPATIYILKITPETIEIEVTMPNQAPVKDKIDLKK